MKTNSKVHSRKKIRVADYIADFLAKKGIHHIFVLTGYGAMYMNDAIAANKKITYYCVRNEAASPMMAEAYARITGTVGAVCLTAGPGSTNAIPGLAEAWVDSAPIIIFSGQVHKAHTTYMAKIEGLRSFGTAEINIIPIVRPLTKYSEMITNPNEIRYHLEKAYYLATSGRPGPTWLDIPHDVQSAMVDEKNLAKFIPPHDKAISKDFDDKLEEIIKLLKVSKKPIIVAGYGVRIAGATKEFEKLLYKLKIPVVFARLGIDILPFSSPFNMGLGGIRGNRFSNSLMKQADLVIVIGARLAIPFIGHSLDSFNKKAKIVVIDIEEAELKKPGVRIDIPINVDASIFIKELFNLVVKRKFKPKLKWLAYCQKVKNKFPMITDSMKKNPIDLYYFMSRLDAKASGKNVLVTDSGSNYYIAGQAWKFEKRQREITSGTFGAMGLSIPLAIGVSVAKPKSQVLAVTGDGSLELNVQELKTMSYYNLNIKLFVINNGGYVSMRRWQDTFFKGRRIGSDEKTGVPVLNLRSVASAFDLDYDIIDSWEKIDEKLDLIMSKKGPLFVEVMCDNRQLLLNPLTSLGVLK